jgi:RNA polymerase sporulation-specific sigma factor
MANFKVDITGINTNDLIVLSDKETKELFIKLNSGDKCAKEKLINGNLKLVLSILKRFNNSKYNMDDLFQVGVIGLIKAIDNFDVSLNLKLSTYAVPLILGEVKRYIRDNTSIRVSRSIKDLAYKILKYQDEYLINHGEYPSNLEISNYLGIDEYEISYALDSLKDPMSIFEPIYNDDGDTIYLSDQIADKKVKNTDHDMLISLNKSLDKIEKREKEILISRFIIGKTQMEIASTLGISQAQVSRLEKSAINRLKRLIN